MSSILSVHNLCKSYGTHRALDCVDLDVERGGIFALLGPNGAGKTTLLRIINSILLPDSGIVTIDGVPAQLGVTTRKLGYMPEERGLYPKMRVEEQIMYFGTLKGCDRTALRRNMDQYMELFQIPGDARRRRIEELSKGNQQKVQVIATIVHEPELVILDEPFSGFDPINGRLLTEVIERLRQLGSTVILSSHNMPAVEEMATHVALINAGKVVLNGPLSSIKKANTTGQLRLTTTSPIDPVKALASEYIDSMDALPEENTYIISPHPGTSNFQVISTVAEQTDIHDFSVVMPTLSELFIKYASRQSL